MPITTYTASEIAPLKQLHAGLNCVRSIIVITPTTNSLGTLTVSSIVYMAKIPAGAVLIDGYLVGGNAGADEGTWNLGIRKGDGGSTFPVNTISGLSVSDNSLLAAVTLSDGVLARFTSGTRATLPYHVSCSDGDANQFHWIVATAVTGSGTQTNSLQLVAMYLSNANS